MEFRNINYAKIWSSDYILVLPNSLYWLLYDIWRACYEVMLLGGWFFFWFWRLIFECAPEDLAVEAGGRLITRRAWYVLTKVAHLGSRLCFTAFSSSRQQQVFSMSAAASTIATAERKRRIISIDVVSDTWVSYEKYILKSWWLLRYARKISACGIPSFVCCHSYLYKRYERC